MTASPIPARAVEGAGVTYIDEVRHGRHRWWHNVLGMLVILFAWLIVGSAVSLLITHAVTGGVDTTELTTFMGLVVTMAAFPIFLLGIYLALRFIHHRSIRSLITPRARIDWTRVGQGAAVWFALWVLGQLVRFFLDPSSFSVVDDVLALVAFAPLAIVMTAIQTTTEELFFRGYVIQLAGLLWARPAFLAITSAALFTLPHLANPEASAGGLLTVFFGYFLSTGVVWAVVSLVDGTLELAIGAHFANNTATILLVGTTGTIIGTPALFTSSTFEPVTGAIIATVIAVLFAVIVLTILRRRPDGRSAAARLRHPFHRE